MHGLRRDVGRALPVAFIDAEICDASGRDAKLCRGSLAAGLPAAIVPELQRCSLL